LNDGSSFRTLQAVIEAALDATPKADSPERALLLATLCSELALGTKLERRTALADDAGDGLHCVTRYDQATSTPATLHRK
jgi:hypothetical protein